MLAIRDFAMRVFVGCVAVTVFACWPGAIFAADGPSSEEALLFRALDHYVSVDFRNEPIRSALDALSSMAPTEEPISLAFDQRSLANEAVSLDANVTLQAKNIRLRSALSFVLGQAGAAWTIKDEMLLITTRKVADGNMLVVSHGMNGLAVREEDSGRALNVRQLIDVIKNEIAPESWDARGGPGSIEFFAQNGFALHRCNLVVRQSAAIHCDISRLLAEFRANVPILASERVILRALDDPTVLEFVETPLRDVIAYLRDLYQIEIQIDANALNESTVNIDQPITRTLRGISLRSALRQLLDPLGLTFVIKNEVLLIIVKEKDGKSPAEVPPDCGQTLPDLSPRAPVEEPLPAK